MSSTPLRSPLSSSTKSRKKPVGGRSPSAAATRRFSACSRFGVRANAAARRSATVVAPQTGSLSTTTESSIRPRSRSGSSSHDRAALSHSPIERANSGLDATAPWGSERRPHADTPSRTRRARPVIVSRSCGSSASSQASAQSTSELGNGSRRPKLPIANHVYGAGGRPSSSSAISIIRRVIVSWMLAIVRLIAADGAPES